MTDLGFICLSLALATTVYSILAFALGVNKRENQLVAKSRKSVHATTALLSLAVLALIYALLVRDFQVEYVASYTSRDLPLAYTFSALWAGQQGSLLFWTWLLSLFASTVLLLHRRRQEPLSPYTSLVIAITEAFFLVLLIFLTNPFQKLDFIPTDGLGMNPLLQNPAMLWHPPILYLGYVGFTVPFAFTIGALISGRLGERYVHRLRRWILFPWLCLGLGTLLGAQWAYVELGWGGYWAWDPVENASLMPWLISTALIHSLMIQERRGTMKVWNMALIVLTFALCIFGTFITRSGVISSVHAFGVSRIGLFFLAFLCFILVGSALLLFRRRRELKAEREWESLISRQPYLLLGIVLWVAATVAILLGTLFPLLSGVTKIALTADYFNRSSVLILGPLILLMGICPFTRWRGGAPKDLMRDLLIPFICALVIAVLLLVLGLRDLFAVPAFSICTFVLLGTLFQFYRGLRARRRASKENYLSAFVSMIWRQRRRYGGYVVHIGIVLIVIGVIGSSAYKVEEQAVLEQGASLTIGDYSLRYDAFSFYPAQGKDVAAATLSIFRGGRHVGVLVPQRHFHHSTQQPVSEVAIRTTLKEDLYVALIGWEDTNSVILLQVIVSPLVVWIWIGGAVLLLGTVIAIWPRPRKDSLEERIEKEITRLRQAGGEIPQGDRSR